MQKLTDVFYMIRSGQVYILVTPIFFLCRHFSWYTKSVLFCKHLSISTIGWQVASGVFNSSTSRFRIYLNECRSSYHEYGEIQIFWSPRTPVTISCLTHITSSSTSWPVHLLYNYFYLYIRERTCTYTFDSPMLSIKFFTSGVCRTFCWVGVCVIFLCRPATDR